MNSQLICSLAVISILLLPLQQSLAATYRYKENAPPAKMMLDMMEVMGVVERVPDGNPIRKRTWPVTSLWGMNPGVTGQNAQWMQQGSTLVPMMWGSAWPGVNSLPSTYFGVNSQAPLSAEQSDGRPGLQAAGQNWPYRHPQRNSLRPENALWSTGIVERQLMDEYLRPGSPEASKKNIPASRPRSLEGRWVGDKNEVLQISGNQFAWRGQSGSVNSGRFTFDGNFMTTSVPNSNAVVRYRIELKEDWLVATSESGYRYQFRRFR